jgi:predicted dehydrogenase
MTILNCAVVGVGALGRHHARILSQLPNVNLVAVAEPNETQGRSVAESCQCDWVQNYQELFGRCDAVSIVVPTQLHYRITKDFLQAGIDVLVEKPLTANAQTAEELVHLAETQQRILQVGHVERFNPAMTALKEHLQSKPRYLTAQRLAPFTFRSTDISVIFDLMIHDIDLCLSLTRSPVVTVKAFGFSLMGDLYDTAQARLWFANGAIADLTASRINPEASRKLQVWTAQECVDVNLHDRTIKHFKPTAELLSGPKPVALAQQSGANIAELKEQVFTRFIRQEQFSPPAVDALTLELEEFTRCVEQRVRPTVDGQAALNAVHVAGMVEESIAQHSWSNWGDTPPRLKIYKAA